MIPLGRTDASGVSRWRRVHDALAAELAAGAVPVGGRLAGEGALARRFAVNRHTVRRALQALAEAGRIRTEHGKGSFVLPDPVRYALGPRTSFTANLADQGLTARRRIEAVEQIRASAAIAGRLAISRGATVIRAVTVAFAVPVPIARSVHYFPARRLPGIAQALQAEEGISAALRAVGQPRLERAATRITTRTATAEEAATLCLAPHAPVLVTDGIDTDGDGTPLQRVVTTFAGSRIELVVER
jgi:GntR family phosphonate transport system transcriptional regulator